MTKRPEIFLGDLLRAFEHLQPGPEERGRLAAMLGYSWVAIEEEEEALPPLRPGGEEGPRREVNPERDKASRGRAPGHSTEPEAPHEPEGGYPVLEPSRSVTVVAQRRRVRETDLFEEEDWIEPPAKESLFAPNWERQLMVELLSSNLEGGPLDLDALVDQVASLRPLESLPCLPWRTLVAGVQVLVDVGDAMEPYEEDCRHFEAEVQQLQRDRLTLLRFADCPAHECGTGGPDDWTPYRLPAEESPVIILGHFGAVSSYPPTRRDVTRDWVELLDELQGQGSAVVALSPFPGERIPGPVAERLKVVHWDRDTTLGAVRDLLEEGETSWRRI